MHACAQCRSHVSCMLARLMQSPTCIPECASPDEDPYASERSKRSTLLWNRIRDIPVTFKPMHSPVQRPRLRCFAWPCRQSPLSCAYEFPVAETDYPPFGPLLGHTGVRADGINSNERYLGGGSIPADTSCRILQLQGVCSCVCGVVPHPRPDDPNRDPYSSTPQRNAAQSKPRLQSHDTPGDRLIGSLKSTIHEHPVRSSMMRSTI